MYIKGLAALAAITSLTCVSGASAQDVDRTKAARIGADTISSIADNFEFQTSFSTYLDEKVLLMERPSGMKAIFTFVGCEDEEALTDCDGMEMRALWAFPTNGTALDVTNRLSDFNSSFRAAKAGAINEKQVYLARYVIADYGTTMGNLGVEVAVFMRLGDKFLERVVQNKPSE
jgi:hypothetical protein